MDNIPIPAELNLTAKDITKGSIEVTSVFAINVGPDGAPESLTLTEVDGIAIEGSEEAEAASPGGDAGPGGIPSEEETMEQFVQKGVEKFNAKK